MPYRRNSFFTRTFFPSCKIRGSSVLREVGDEKRRTFYHNIGLHAKDNGSPQRY